MAASARDLVGFRLYRPVLRHFRWDVLSHEGGYCPGLQLGHDVAGPDGQEVLRLMMRLEIFVREITLEDDEFTFVFDASEELVGEVAKFSPRFDGHFFQVIQDGLGASWFGSVAREYIEAAVHAFSLTL
jgi:hypothetical protein